MGHAPWRPLPPQVSGFVHARAPYCYRCPFKLTYPDCGLFCLDFIRQSLKTTTAGMIAAIIVEPMQGTAGNVIPPKGFLTAVQSIAKELGALFIADEMITGFGRTGKMWGIEHYPVEPDLMCIAKSIAGGLPLSGVLGRAEIMDAPGDSAIGGTYVGNPVAQAAALAVLDVFEEEGLVDRAAQLGETIRERMQNWQQRWPAIGDVRGLGAMLAIELVNDATTKDPAPGLATKVVEAAAERGLLLLKSGIYSNCIRVLVPLVISSAELDEALDVWEDALDSALSG